MASAVMAWKNATPSSSNKKTTTSSSGIGSVANQNKGSAVLAEKNATPTSSTTTANQNKNSPVLAEKNATPTTGASVTYTAPTPKPSSSGSGSGSKPKTPSSSSPSGGGSQAAPVAAPVPEAEEIDWESMIADLYAQQDEAIADALARQQEKYESRYADLYNQQNKAIADALAGQQKYYDEAIAQQNAIYESNLKAQKEEQERALAEQQKAIQAGVEKAQGSLKAQQGTTSQNYSDLYRQLYINNMNQKKGIDQQLAASGQTGGAAESTLLGLATEYNDAIRQGKISETQAINELERAITDAGLSGSIEGANAIAQNALQNVQLYGTDAANRANAFANYANNAANAVANSAALGQSNVSSYLGALQNLAGNEQSERQFQTNLAYNQANNSRQYAYQLAMQMLQNGQMPDDGTLASAGINKNDALAIVAGNAQKISGNSGSSGTTYGIDTNDYNTYQNAVQQILEQSTPRNAMNYINELYNNNYLTDAAKQTLNKLVTAR